MRRALIAVPRTGDGTSANPYSCALTVEGWQDVTGQPVADIATGQLPYSVEATLTDAQLAAIKADASYAVLWDVDADDPEAVGVVDTAALSNLYHADIAAYVAEQPDPVEALLEVQRRPPWQAGIAVAVGDVYAFGDNLYRCVQPHTTQADWTPPLTPALWVRFHEVEAGPQPWVQPTGAHDAYPLGAQVTHVGRLWESLYDANVWEPSVFGWRDLGPIP